MNILFGLYQRNSIYFYDFSLPTLMWYFHCTLSMAVNRHKTEINKNICNCGIFPIIFHIHNAWNRIHASTDKYDTRIAFIYVLVDNFMNPIFSNWNLRSIFCCCYSCAPSHCLSCRVKRRKKAVKRHTLMKLIASPNRSTEKYGLLP